MQVAFRDFRSFHKTDYIDLKEINLLVGENSSGKTSFLAAIRFVYSLFSPTLTNSLNQYPYSLGSFEDIAHFRGGRFGRASEFSFSIRGDLSRKEIEDGFQLYGMLGAEQKLTDEIRSYTLDVHFFNYRSQPRIKIITFRCGRFRFSVDLSQVEIRVKVKTPSVNEETDVPLSRFIGADDIYFNASYLRYMLVDLIYSREHASREGARRQRLPKSFQQEILLLSAYYSAAQSQIGNDVYATAPVRTGPRRVYNPADVSPTTEGDNAPILLAQMSAFDSERWEHLKTGLDRFGKASGLFSSINVKHLAKSKTGPFQITVSVGKVKSSIVDVGYGVSQALPIIYELLVRENSSTFLFQQPEVHLHPRAQAELASFVMRTAHERHHQIFIETHSDYIVDRIRMDVRDEKSVYKNTDVSILYFKKNELDTEIVQIGVDKEGNIVGAPPGYREFFLREKARSIGILK